MPVLRHQERQILSKVSGGGEIKKAMAVNHRFGRSAGELLLPAFSQEWRQIKVFAIDHAWIGTVEATAWGGIEGKFIAWSGGFDAEFEFWGIG